jgi:hypothetical protein
MLHLGCPLVQSGRHRLHELVSYETEVKDALVANDRLL